MVKKHVPAEAGSPSSKAAALLARGAYFQYVSTANGRERRWWLFSTFPFRSVTVIAQDGVMADGFDTGIFVMGPEKGHRSVSVFRCGCSRLSCQYPSAGLQSRLKLERQDFKIAYFQRIMGIFTQDVFRGGERLSG